MGCACYITHVHIHGSNAAELHSIKCETRKESPSDFKRAVDRELLTVKDEKITKKAFKYRGICEVLIRNGLEFSLSFKLYDQKRWQTDTRFIEQHI